MSELIPNTTDQPDNEVTNLEQEVQLTDPGLKDAYSRDVLRQLVDLGYMDEGLDI